MNGEIKPLRSFKHHHGILVLPIALFFSSFTLWLVESQIKYALFVFEASIIVVIYYLLFEENGDGKRYGSQLVVLKHIKGIITTVNFEGLFLDIFLIATSSVLLLINALHLVGGGVGIIQLVLAFLSTSILSGYSLISIFNITKYFSKLEIMILSYLSSFIFSGFITLALLSVDENTRSVITIVFFILVGAISAFLRYFRRKVNGTIARDGRRPNSLSRNIDIIAIALSIIFYLIFFYYTYPGMVLVPNSDISRHYMDSIILSRTPDLYTGFYYVLFHSFEAALLGVSGFQQTITSFHTIQILLNIFLPASIYALAKRFLEKVDRRIPALSAIFYAVLSNFSFIYFTQLKLLSTGSAGEIQLLGLNVAEKAYNGTINFMQPFPWFEPASISFIMFMTLFLLLRVQSLPRLIFVPIYSTLILAMYFTHVAEAVILVTFIAVYSIIHRRYITTLRLDDALLSSLISFAVAIAFSAYIAFAWRSKLISYDFTYMLPPLILPIAMVGIAMIWRWQKKISLKVSFNKQDAYTNQRFYTVLSIVLVSIYLYGFIAWFFIGDFKTSSVVDTGITPWFIYPIVLGITGLLATLSIRHLGGIIPNASVSVIVAAIIFMVIMGRVVSFMNVNFVATGYWEKRFLSLIFLFACLLAPIALIKFKELVQSRVTTKGKSLLNNSFLITVISLVVVSGFSSMVIQSEYWFDVVNSDTHKVSDKEFEAVYYLRSILQHDAYAFTITPSRLSHDALVFAAPGYQFSLPEISISSKYPDIALLSLSAYDLRHAYLYIDKRDFSILDKQSQSWFVQHLLPMLPVVFSNSEATIYNATHVSSPLSNSDTAMLIPSDPRIAPANSWSYAYDVISQSGKNYTVMYDRDPNALRSKTVILSFDPMKSYSYHSMFSSYTNASNNNNNKNGNTSWNIVSGNWKYSDGLHGGKSSSGQNIILSRLSSRNFTANTSFRIDKISPHVANYVSIVYSWIDPENYQYAGITILNNNDVYVSSTTVSGGKVSVNPPWPGVKTNLVWKPGDLFNLTLSVRNDEPREGLQQHLFLNGTKYYLAQGIGHSSKSGYLGLSYSRIQDVLFERYNVQDMSTLDLRPSSDYMTYVKSGGHLIVLDTNGYGSIAHSLFNTSKALSSETRTLPLVISNSSTTQEGQSLTISVTEANIGHGKITYVNIRPILSNYFENKTPGITVYKTFERVSKVLGLGPNVHSPPNFKDVVATFRGMTGNGIIKVSTTSVIFPAYTRIDRVTVTTSGHKNITSVANVTKLDMDGYRYVILEGRDPSSHNYISLTNGVGLYSGLVLGKANNSNSMKLSFNGGVAKIRIIATDSSREKSFDFNNVSNIHIVSNEQPIYIYARQPTININNGDVAFTELHSQPFYLESTALGHMLRILGNVHLSIFMSDTYTLLHEISINNSSKLTAPTVKPYNEMTSFLPQISLSKVHSVPLLVIGLLLIPFLISVIFLLYSRVKQKEVNTS